MFERVILSKLVSVVSWKERFGGFFSFFEKVIFKSDLKFIYIYSFMKTVRVSLFTSVGGDVCFLLPTLFSPQCVRSRC